MNHLSADELLCALYDAQPPAGHLAGCPECQARLAGMRARREQAAVAPELDAGFLARQRAGVYARLESRYWNRLAWRTATGLLGATAMIVGFLVYDPGIVTRKDVARQVAVDDAQLLADVYAAVQTEEPRAAAPIRGLFDDEEVVAQ